MVPEKIEQIHSFNPRPFEDISTAMHVMSHKKIDAGEIIVAYYRDIHEETGIGSLISIGNLMPGGNQVFRNQLYIDTLINELSEKEQKLDESVRSL